MLMKPEWLRQKMTNESVLEDMEAMLTSLSLHTVCEGANCPNIGRCFEKKTATFMIMGNICTRGCRFCAVGKGSPTVLDPMEPYNVAIAVKKLELKHVVITSVTRDDLDDGGAQHYVETVKETRKINPDTTIELLIPDLNGNWDDLKKIVNSRPDIINHNMETVPSLYGTIRPQAIYHRSIKLLRQVKNFDRSIYTKSGLMLGLGESDLELDGVMDDLVGIDCDILTMGQYLRPSPKHVEIQEYISPEKFDYLKEIALNKGFEFVAQAHLSEVHIKLLRLWIN